MVVDFVTLTTNTADLMISENKFTNDVDPGSQNSKTVECRLGLTYKKIAVTEGNIFLFKSLKSMGLATNDVHNFIKKQTIHKRVDSKISGAKRRKTSSKAQFLKI